jgi:serine/threonine protein kinase/Flp pilus assembly protein TadD
MSEPPINDIPAVSGPDEDGNIVNKYPYVNPYKLSKGDHIGDFEILEPIGHGGMGAVYKAHEISLKRVVALKMLHPAIANDPFLMKRFRREAILAANLSHPNIVPVFHIEDSEKPRYFTMEFIQGISLREKVEKNGFLDADQAIRITLQVCEALQYAHEHNIIHRDIKPDNILLQNHVERVRVADFGIAQDISGRFTQVTQPGQSTPGTLGFESPEQNLGGNLDERTDIFSLGMTLFYMLTGQLPYKAKNRQELTLAFKEQKPPSPSHYNPEVSRTLDAIVMRMIAIDKNQRYHKAKDISDELKKISAREVYSLSALKRISNNIRYNKFVKYCVALLLLLSVFVGVATIISISIQSRPEVIDVTVKNDFSQKIGHDEEKGMINSLPIVWQTNLDGSSVVTNNNSIVRVKLTPDNNSVMVFHYNGGRYGIPTQVDKLDASTGNFIWPLPGYKTVTKPNERISLNGWVDGSGNLFIMGSWSGNTIWKYDSELATELCSYTGRSGFEYVRDAITDEFDNVYVAGMTGSGSNQGSRLVKLDKNCNEIWTCLSKTTSDKDDYCMGIGLDSEKNVFRVGTDSSFVAPDRFGASDHGRLIGHRASDGGEFFNYTVEVLNSRISGITIDSDDYIYIAYCYNYSPSGQERTVVQKLVRNGSTASVVWEYWFDNIGMYLGRDVIVKATEKSFYMAFNLRQNDITVPGIAEIDLDGNILWKGTIDRPGWNLSSIDAKKYNIYVGLTNDADGSQSQVICLESVAKADTYFVLGAKEYKLRRYDEAIEAFTKAINIKPDYVDAYLRRGNAYGGKDEQDKAISDYSKAIELAPKYAEVYINRGLSYSLKGEYGKAMLDYDKAIELDPTLASVYINRGMAYNSRGEFDKAILDISRAIELDSKNALFYIERAKAYALKGENEKALSDLNKAIKLDSNKGIYYFFRANIYNKLGDFEKASSDRVKAAELGYHIP